MILAVEFTIDLVSGANVRRGAREYMNRVKRHREAAKFWLMSASRNQKKTPQLPCVITLTRYGVKRLDGHENLSMSFKHVVDGIACKPTRTRPAGFFEVDDADPRFTWRYAQFKVPRMSIGPVPGQSRVRIELEWKDLSDVL